MRALITGATGFIGLALVRHLIRDGHEATVLVRSRERSKPDPVAELRDYGATVVEGTVFDAEILAGAIENRDVVFHVAWHWHRPDAPGAPQAASAAEQWHINVDGTRLLIEAAKRAAVRRLVFTSTVWVYPASLQMPIREDAGTFSPETVRGHPAEGYVAPKLAVEEMIRHLMPPPEYVILRPSLTYGVGARWAPDILKGMLKGPPKRRVRSEHWVHVDDVADAMILAAEVPGAAGMTFNLAGPETIGSDQMRDVVQRMAARLTQHPAARTGIAVQPSTAHFDIGMARRHLGYEPKVHIADGLEEMLAALLKETPLARIPPPPMPAWQQQRGAPGFGAAAPAMPGMAAMAARWGGRPRAPWRPG